MKYFSIFAIFLFVCQEKHHADKVILGKTWTGNERQPWSESLAIVADSIVFVGTAAEFQNRTSDDTRVVTLKEPQIVVPGFIDTHTRILSTMVWH